MHQSLCSAYDGGGEENSNFVSKLTFHAKYVEPVFFVQFGFALSTSFRCYHYAAVTCICLCFVFIYLHECARVCISLKIVFSAFYFTPHFIYENIIRFSLEEFFNTHLNIPSIQRRRIYY